MDRSHIVHNFFKNGEQKPSMSSYTNKWIELINQMERYRNIAVQKCHDDKLKKLHM